MGKAKTCLSQLSGLSLAGDLQSLGDDCGEPDHRRFFTCTVGRKPSAAKFYVDDTDEVSELLTNLKQQHDKMKDAPPNYHTWSGSDPHRSMRVGSMPALSTLAFSSSNSSRAFRQGASPLSP